MADTYLTELEEAVDRKVKLPNKNTMKNLPQYKGMTDAEFEEMYAKLTLGLKFDKAWETRIQIKWKEFETDYDLSDLKVNDVLSLRALISAYLRLEDLDYQLGAEYGKGISLNNMQIIEKISQQQEGLRKDISKLQDDLKISRKVRKDSEDGSAIQFLEDLKVKAKKFYESKMQYIFCPKCNTLLMTVWWLYPEFKENKVHLTCHRHNTDGTICGGIVEFNSKEILENKMSNKPEIMPDSIK